MSHAQPDKTSDLVAYKPYPGLAAALRARIPVILQKWEGGVRKMLPKAQSMTHEAFKDDVPVTLKRLADALASDRPVGLYDLEDTARVHGTSRFDQDFNIREIITEFRLLRRIILEEVHAERGAEFTHGEMVELSMATDAAFQETLLAFVDHQRSAILAATAAEAKFLSFMSHDLRNHLNHVTLAIEVISARLRDRPDFAEDVAELGAAQNAIFETLRGMERLLESERLRKGAVTLRREPVDLQALGQQLLQQMQMAAGRKGLELRMEIPKGAVLHTDPQLLTLILQNLLGNAVKYTAAGFVALAAERFVQEKDAGWMLSVVDSGPGIPPENAKALFQAFTRGATHGQPGVGLGLAIASQAAKLLEASLTLDTSATVGTTFHLKVISAGGAGGEHYGVQSIGLFGKEMR